MKRIGLYLSGFPEEGGAYQYKLSMIDAVLALPADTYHPVIAVNGTQWLPYIKAGSRTHTVLHASPSWPEQVAVSTWERMGLPVGWWRQVAGWLSPFVRTIVAQRCDLWIFPSSESWTFRTPVRSMGVIFDLMHRYETRFPEVGKRSEYHRRERRFRRLCRWADAILVDSEIGADQASESYPVCAGKLHVLPFAPPAYIYHSASPPDFDHRYCLPSRYLFYPAQFWEHKNHKALVRALAKLRDIEPAMQMVFVGAEKNVYDSVMELARQFGVADRVIVFGYVPNEDLVELYRRARALVMPTFFGPTNIPPLEAMTLGCPVAVSGIYAMPGQYGDAALYFDPASDNEIAEALLRLWTDDELCRHLREAGRAVAAEYDQRHFNRRFRDIVDSVVHVKAGETTKTSQAL